MWFKIITYLYPVRNIGNSIQSKNTETSGIIVKEKYKILFLIKRYMMLFNLWIEGNFDPKLLT
jgi:hypothetical protein